MSQTKNILIVDDEPDLIEIIQYALSELGEDVNFVTAQDGLDAYRKARNQSFDLICSDFKMPKLTGASLITALREQWHNASTPVIVLTGYPEDAQAECKAQGIFNNIRFMTKPFKTDDLVDLARAMLSAGPQAVTAATPKGPPPAPPKLDVEFLNPFIEAVTRTMKTMGQVTSVNVEKMMAVKPGSGIVADISGMLSIIAPLFTGTIYVSFPERTFLAIVSKMLGEEFTSLTPDIEDAAAELTNIIYGAAKVTLNEKGHQVNKAIPSIVTGANHAIRAEQGSPMLVMKFNSSAGIFFLAIALNAPGRS